MKKKLCKLSAVLMMLLCLGLAPITGTFLGTTQTVEAALSFTFFYEAYMYNSSGQLVLDTNIPNYLPEQSIYFEGQYWVLIDVNTEGGYISITYNPA